MLWTIHQRIGLIRAFIDQQLIGDRVCRRVKSCPRMTKEGASEAQPSSIDDAPLKSAVPSPATPTLSPARRRWRLEGGIQAEISVAVAAFDHGGGGGAAADDVERHVDAGIAPLPKGAVKVGEAFDHLTVDA
jgi:hypothetical protein